MRVTTAVLTFILLAGCSGSGGGGAIDLTSLSGRIVFDNSQDIWSINANGTGLRRLTRSPWPEFDPSWSPDGRFIAYRSEPHEYPELWVMNADGSGQRRLPHTDAGEYPSWSPDGKRIAFHSNRSGHHLMYVVDVDGSRVVNLSRVGEGGLVAWSPDGRSIVFASQRDHSDNSRDIYVMRPDGSSLRRLTRTPAPGADTPAWSPDSRYIVYARAGGLGVMRADGSGATLLPIEGVGEAVFPDWRGSR